MNSETAGGGSEDSPLPAETRRINVDQPEIPDNISTVKKVPPAQGQIDFQDWAYLAQAYSGLKKKSVPPVDITPGIMQEGVILEEQVAAPKKLAALEPDKWAAMNEKSRWDTLVALRGPDLINSSLLKWFTTSVIRNKMRKITNSHGMVNSVLSFVTLTKEPPKKANFDINHFLNHVREAAEWLEIPILWVDQETFKLLLGEDHSYSSILPKLVPFAKGSIKAEIEALIKGGYL